MSIATHEAAILATDVGPADPRATLADSPDLERKETSSELERSADLEVQLAIQTIASRILAAALLERAQEAESIAT